MFVGAAELHDGVVERGEGGDRRAVIDDDFPIDTLGGITLEGQYLGFVQRRRVIRDHPLQVGQGHRLVVAGPQDLVTADRQFDLEKRLVGVEEIMGVAAKNIILEIVDHAAVTQAAANQIEERDLPYGAAFMRLPGRIQGADLRDGDHSGGNSQQGRHQQNGDRYLRQAGDGQGSFRTGHCAASIGKSAFWR